MGDSQRTKRPSRSRAGGARAARSGAGADPAAVTAGAGEPDRPGTSGTDRSRRAGRTRSTARDGAHRAEAPAGQPAGAEDAGGPGRAPRAERSHDGGGSSAATGGPEAGGAARRPGSRRGVRRGGTRRAVGPLIGENLAQELLSSHQPDVLLSGQCVCGMGFPCPSRLFATCFVSDEPVPNLERALRTSQVVLEPERWWPPAGPAPRHAVATVAEEGRTEPRGTGRRWGRHATRNGEAARPRPAEQDRGSYHSPHDAAPHDAAPHDAAPHDAAHAAHAAHAPAHDAPREAPPDARGEGEPHERPVDPGAVDPGAVDPDATQQLPKIPADPSPVAVAV